MKNYDVTFLGGQGNYFGCLAVIDVEEMSEVYILNNYNYIISQFNGLKLNFRLLHQTS